jgi:tRNA pseudouridine38-40 synthase
MTIAYKGDEFHGFATNPGVDTIASTIEGALAQILQEPVQVTPAGRTDAGVHAWGQVISLDLAERVN